MMPTLRRRDYLKTLAGSLGGLSLGGPRSSAFAAAPAESPAKKSIAAIVTVYHHNSHADVLLTKILEGWKHDGGPGPALSLASMYVEQFPKGDMARDMSAKHGVPMFESIEQAITVGSDGIPVDGVILIGEHGNYPWNEKEQHLYPRRRFFAETTDTFAKYGRVVPVFHDKHPGPQWDDAKWMYDRAREMKVPFMAGSSLPVSFREPDLSIPMGSELEGAVGIGYSGLDVYGFHALECYQAFVERRRGAEQGVKSVQFHEGPDVWRVLDDGTVSGELFEAALAATPHRGKVDPRDDPRSALFLFEYVDGFTGALFMLQTVNRSAVAVKLSNESEPRACHFAERPEPRYPHFAYLLKAIERMMHTGRPTYRVERTMLTAGILDRALTSRHEGGRKLDTPELQIAYEPVDYPHAPQPDLLLQP
ncbi:hypothetical protein Mal4_20000 [Maioricimonas rarisocia]|uniref:Uncharacterized protein n=1 Tax=Maioricimonas rarisocia TaxID=2528026 RepID=A0A517Z5E0_9PLAN|nr:hypothetical protein [Maioricimonas rarisocia]QDU37684.1 hypothetical protein Mal4_20000 [Maioricimonas rarisocia]